MEEGLLKGEQCNRDGCSGIIDEHESDGCCSCHINPPCGYCTTDRAYCPVCFWDGGEEQIAAEKANTLAYNESVDNDYWKKQREDQSEREDLFMKKYRGEIEAKGFDYRKYSHTNSSMRVLCVYPKGFDISTVMNQIQGTFGGRLVRKSDVSAEYIAYTD